MATPTSTGPARISTSASSRPSPARPALEELALADPRLVLVPVEELGTDGTSGAFRALAAERALLDASALDLLDAGLERYERRGWELRARGVRWPIPRRRHVAVLLDPEALHPLAQLLNEGAWTLHACDLDADVSHPELVAALLAMGDWMTATGEVSLAALRGAAWWLLRNDAECEAFEAAAARSRRPDADAWRALAEALPWIRELRHPALRPVEPGDRGRPVPGTGLVVPEAHVARPAALIECWKQAVHGAVERHRSRHRAPGEPAIARLVAWLARASPRLTVVRDGERLFDPTEPGDATRLGAALLGAEGPAVEGLHRELEIIDERTRLFLSACAEPEVLWAGAPPELEPGGYAYLDPERRVLALRLDEPGMERLHGPPLPFAHAMLGARCLHEWAHLADTAGFVPLGVEASERAARELELAGALDRIVRDAPGSLRAELLGEAEELGLAERAPGEGLVALLTTRLPDYRANLLMARLATRLESEIYVRHNVRSLGRHHGPGSRLRLLLRYLHEFQYLGPALGLSAIEDPAGVFLAITGAETELGADGWLDREAFLALCERVAWLYRCWAVDEDRFRPEAR